MLDTIRMVLAQTKWATVGLFGFYYFYKHLRFLRYKDHYFKEYLADVLNLVVWGLVLVVTISLAVSLIRKLLILNSEEENGSSSGKKHHPFTRKDTVHCLISGLILLGVFYRTDAIYASRLSYPYGFGYMPNFRFYMLFFSICATSMKLRTKGINSVVVTCF